MMSEKFSISTDIPSKILDIIVYSLNQVGIKLPPFLLQLFLFLLALIAILLVILKLVRHYRAGEKSKVRNPTLILTATGLGLIIIGILFTWFEQAVFPLPDEIRGHIEIAKGSEAPSFGDLKVYVLDFQNRKLGESRVDTTDGRFGVYWNPSFGIRPRSLKIEAPGCDDVIKTLEYYLIRKSEVEVLFNCKKPS